MPKLAVLLACVLLGASLPATSSAMLARRGSPITDQCKQWKGHVAEACAAYISWDAHAALQLYYKYVNSHSLLAGFKNIFPKRYKGTAPATIQAWAGVANWPTGTNNVDGPNISIIRAKSSLACERAILVTREDWTVTSKTTGAVLYQETQQVHTVLLRRVPGEIFVINGKSLHAWDVFAIYKGSVKLPVC